MKLWIDNTGLQSAGVCLERRARSDYDVRGLLQLATLVIFGDNISLNGFEDEIIAARSRAMAHSLESVGVRDIVFVRPVSEPAYKQACKAAAEKVASDLSSFLVPGGVAPWSTGEPPDLPRGLLERQFRYVELANESEGSARLRDVEALALQDKAVGAVEYMMAISPELRDSVARLRRTSTFGDRESYDLNIVLRYHLNESLADRSSSTYAPALGRAERVTRRSNYVIDVLSAVADNTANDLRKQVHLGPLGIPSVLAAILERSKGEPKRVFEVAMKFRQQAWELRQVLQELAAKYPEDTPESRLERQKYIAELGQQLRRDVGLDRATSVFDAIQVQFAFAVPVPTVRIGELLRWLREFQKRRRAAVLTELVRS